MRYMILGLHTLDPDDGQHQQVWRGGADWTTLSVSLCSKIDQHHPVHPSHRCCALRPLPPMCDTLTAHSPVSLPQLLTPAAVT